MIKFFFLFLCLFSFAFSKSTAVKKGEKVEIAENTLSNNDQDPTESAPCPSLFKKARIKILKKSTHHVTNIEFKQKQKEQLIDNLKIVCHGAFIQKIDSKFNGYWAFIEVFENKEDHENLVFSNWINDKTATVIHPDWIIKLLDCTQ
ncbi:MAG: hypothetical protein HEEMFOPI_00405 [Holosporales bacterium]